MTIGPWKRLLGTPPGGGYNLDKLREEAAATFGASLRDVNEISDGAQLAVYLHNTWDGQAYVEHAATAGQWQAVLDVHVKTAKTAKQLVDQQLAQADSRLGGLWEAAFRNLSAEDAVIILWAKRLAQIRNDSPTLGTALDARNYVNGEWTAASTDAQKGVFIRDSFQAMLEIMARVLVK